jgi:hypothetical protein
MQHRGRSSDPAKTTQRLKRRHLYAKMANMEGLLDSVQASIGSCRDDAQVLSLRTEAIALADRLEEAREEARQRWGVQFMKLAMEDYRLQFGNEEIPDEIAEEDEVEETEKPAEEDEEGGGGIGDGRG